MDERIRRLQLQERRAIARSPHAKAQLLVVLAHSSDGATRAGVAQNANTPFETVWRLAPQHPQSVVENPARFLWPAVRPGFLSEVPVPALKAVLLFPDVPTDWMRWTLQQQSEIYRPAQKALARNDAAPRSVVQALLEREIVSARDLAHHPAAPPDLIDNVGSGTDTYGHARVAENPSASEEVMQRLSDNHSDAVRKRLARNPSLPDGIIIKLAADSNPAVRREWSLPRRLRPRLFF